MKINEAVKIAIIIAILIVAFSIAYYFVIFSPKTNFSKDTVSNTLRCNELYELKKLKYWGNNIGQSKAIYSNTLDTCLALNMHMDFDTKKYFAMVLDMSNDSTLMYYSSDPQGFYFEGDKRITCKQNYIYFKFMQNGEKVKEYGCELNDKEEFTGNFFLFDKMLEKVRSYGFKIFDGFISE